MSSAAELEKDLSWRESELAALKILVSSSPKGSTTHNALLRSMLAMLYAHYEGFTKFAWDLYLDELESLNLKRSQLHEQLIKFSFEKQFQKLRGNMSSDSIWTFCTDGFKTAINEVAIFATKLETDSNLWPNIFEDNATKVNLSCDVLKQNRTAIKLLVDRRNNIAHGKKLIVNELQEYQKFEDAALLIMHELAVCIVDSLDNKLYLKP